MMSSGDEGMMKEEKVTDVFWVCNRIWKKEGNMAELYNNEEWILAV